MKKQQTYTFIISENSSSRAKVFTIRKKYIHIALGSLGAFLLLLTAFLTDYFGLHVDQWKLAQLKTDNSRLEQKFAQMNSQLKGLENKVHQINDFSKKLQLITQAPSELSRRQTGFGRVHSSSDIVSLTTVRQASRSPSALNSSFHEEKQDKLEERILTDVGGLEIRMEKLKGKSQLIKQDIWTLYTDLHEKRELLNNTPSILPVRGWVSSSFGYRNETIYSDHEPHFHRGVDVASTEGNPVMASADGKVVYTGYDEGYGNLIVVDHGYGLKTYYAHLAEIKTNIGDKVQRGETIGSVGSTGRSTGPHLHYEIRMFGTPVNPDNYILDQNEVFVY